MLVAADLHHIKTPIHLIGPGGAGKSSAGADLSRKIGLPLVDLDEHFSQRISTIGLYIRRHGYAAYARQNVRLYFELFEENGPHAVFALSSGFMVYPVDCHEEYEPLLRTIEQHPATIMLIPSFSFDECVRVTVQRQCARPYLQTTAEKETRKIRQRFLRYMNLPCHKVESNRPLPDLVSKIIGFLTDDNFADIA